MIALLTVLLAAPAAGPELRLVVDAAEAPRKILHARVALRAPAGRLTLVYPKWIPGEHGPTGPITNLAGLQITADGKPLPWQRDPDDMYAFQVEVPRAGAVEAAFDFLLAAGPTGFTAGASSSSQLAVVSWNHVVLYPKGARARDLSVAASLIVPAGWKTGTALPVARQAGGRIDFQAVSLETLVDSPVLAGAHLRDVALASGHVLHLAGDSPAAIWPAAEVLAPYQRLVTESGALFGARPYRSYHFLLTLSDHVAHFGLEHHESSDNRQRERTLLEEPLRVLGAGLLPHEMVHSWNGKHRRPAELVTEHFHQPMRTGLLWVYEGLTTYLGEVLTARSGLRTAEQAREALALTAASLDVAPGRTWRPLADTAVAAQVLYGAPREWRSWRRGVDFYPESELIWLEADAVIRGKTGGRKSLDDFCRAFHGAAGGAPSVRPYTLEDVVRALGEVAAHDWRAFFAARVDAPTKRAPLGGLEGSGWRLVYRDRPTGFFRHVESVGRIVDLTFSLGLLLREDGGVIDVLPGTPAAKAGVAPGTRVVAIGGRRFTPEGIRDAVRVTQTRPDLELLVENGDYFRTHRLAYRGGARYPALERDSGKPDLLSQILAPAAAK